MIRHALPTDAKAIAHVHVSSWQAAYRDLMPAQYLDSLGATLPKREAHWARAIEAGEPCVFVAEVNGQVVGWIAVGACRDEDVKGRKVGEVMAIYVLAAYWQTGVGLALWQAGVAWLAGQGFEALTLWVLSGNARAIRFYRGVGCGEDVGSERGVERGGSGVGGGEVSVGPYSIKSRDVKMFEAGQASVVSMKFEPGSPIDCVIGEPGRV